MADRRTFLRQLAALPLVGGGAAAAQIDSPIDVAFREYARLASIADNLQEAEDQAAERYVEPERPQYRMMYSPGSWTNG